jgi:2,3-bisphosphoglycerate-dependent phosphoglycerate mutase
MVHSTLPTDGACPGAAAAFTGRALWLVRHGESTWNRLGLAQGHNDEAELTNRGQQHARDVARALRDHLIAAVYVSDLRRAVQTATPLAAALGLPMYPDARLRERCLGVMEGAALTGAGPAVTGIQAGLVIDPDARPEGGESLRDFYQRAAAFAGDLAVRAAQAAVPPGDIVVVAHGGTLRVLRAYLHGLPVEQMSWMPVPNGSILRVAGGPDGNRRDSARREHT